MSTLASTMTEQRSPSKLPLLLMALALIAGVIALFSTGFEHATSRHGEGAFIVRDCLQKNGAIQIWHNPATGKNAEICQVGPGLFGIRISRNNFKDDVTFFLKEKMRRIEQVEKYLTNTGYTRIR